MLLSTDGQDLRGCSPDGLIGNDGVWEGKCHFMPVEKLSRLRSKLEELRRERQQIVDALGERQQELEKINGVISGFLKLKNDAIEEARKQRTPHKSEAGEVNQQRST